MLARFIKKPGLPIETACVGLRNKTKDPSSFLLLNSKESVTCSFVELFKNYGAVDDGKTPIICGCTNFCADDTCPNRRDRVECQLCSPGCMNKRIFYQKFVNSYCLFPWLDMNKLENGASLRCKFKLPKGTWIGEYCGHIYTEEKYESLYRQMYHKNTQQYGFYVASYVVDASSHGSMIRYANHSCDANASIEQWSQLGEMRLILVATKDIPANTDITYNYYLCNPEGVNKMKIDCDCPPDDNGCAPETCRWK